MSKRQNGTLLPSSPPQPACLLVASKSPSKVWLPLLWHGCTEHRKAVELGFMLQAPCNTTTACHGKPHGNHNHLPWHMEGIVTFRGCSVGLETFGACVLNDWADSHVWLSASKGMNNCWTVCVDLFFDRFSLFSPTPKRMNNIKTNQ